MLARPARVLVSLCALRALDAGVQAREVLPNRTVVLSLASGAEVRRATLARHWARFDAPPLRFWDAFTGDQVAAAPFEDLVAHGVHPRALELGWARSHPTALAAALSHLAIWRALAAEAGAEDRDAWWYVLEDDARVANCADGGSLRALIGVPDDADVAGNRALARYLDIRTRSRRLHH